MKGKITVFDAVVDFSSTNIGTTNWIPVGSTLGVDLVKLKISDLTNSEFEIGYGGPGQSGPAYVAQRAFRSDPGGGMYDQIFNKNMQIFIRLIQGVGGATSLTSGRVVFNGLY